MSGLSNHLYILVTLVIFAYLLLSLFYLIFFYVLYFTVSDSFWLCAVHIFI